MSGIRDTATVTLNVNGAQAKQMLADITKKVQDQTAYVDELKKKMADPKEIQKAIKQLNEYKKQLAEMESAMVGVNKALDNLDNATPRQLERALRTLNKQLKDMVPGSEVWDSHVKKINELKARLQELKPIVEEQTSIWGKFKNWADDTWPAIDLLSRGYNTVVSPLRELVSEFAAMDQEMANVRKFTGMTEEDVRALNEEFKKIDTRTAREELNKLAQEAGRLGLSSQEDVLGFVRAADKINVALDDLGEGATLTLSKLTDIFGDKQRFGVEQSLLKTGSVINELSQSCTASAPFIANFAERMSGVGVQAKLSVPEVMAFGAVLDSLGLKVEASSTALSQVLVRMMQDPAKYATVAGIEVSKFASLLKEDANEALMVFLENLNKSGGLNQLAPMFSEMGENGSRVIATLTSLANNIDLVRQRQDEANQAFEEGTSIDKEFNVQNNTVQANLEKALKNFTELRVELGEKLSPLMAHVVSSTSAIIRAVSTVVDFVYKFKSVLIPLVTVIGSYYVAVLAASVAQKAWTAAIMLGRTAIAGIKYVVGLLQVAMIALTHGTKAAGTAFTFLNSTMKANPFGLVIASLTAVYLLIKKLIPATDEYAKKMKSAVSLATSFNESLEKEQKELDKLFGELEGATEGTKEYLKAKDRLLRQYGSYLEGLVTEEGKIIDLEKAYKRLSEAIRIANEERGIKEARDAVDDAYYNQMKELQAQLSASLTAYGADTREAARLAMQVSTAMSANRALSQDVIDRINELSKNAPSSEAAEGWWDSFWSHLSPNAQNSTIGQIFNVDQVLQPAELVNRMYSAQDVRKTSLNEIDIIEREQRPLGGLEDNMLECLISYAQKAVDNGGGNVISVDNALSGVFEVSKATASEAKELLEQLKGEQAYRSGKAASSGDGTNPEVTIPTAPDPDKNGDRFAAEKAWKEKEEALSRIAYAKGEKSHSEHNARMLEIATDYNQMLLDRTDLTAEERLSIQADYWEAVNKENTAKSKELIEEESISYESLKSQITKNYIDRLKTENLSAEERSNADKVHKEALELAELNHLARMVELYEEGSAERLKAQQAYQNAQLKAAQRHQQEYEKQEAEFAKLKSKYFGNNPSEDKAAYDKQIAALQVVYNRELKAAGDNAEERLRIEEAFQKAKQALALQYNQASEVDTRNSMEKAVASSVEWLNSDGGKAVTGAISTLTSGMSSIFSGLSSMIQAELTIETAAIEKRYEREVALAQGNSYKVAKAEKQKEADIAKAKNDANKKMFAMQVIQAVAQTATNALNAYGSAAAVPVIGYILAPIAAAMAVAAGAIQIASIKKQAQASEAQGYAEGGFTRPGGKYEPAGVVHAGEWVASQKLLASPVARPLINALDYAQRTNTIGSLNSEDVSSSITASNSLARIADSGASGAMVVAALSRFAEVGERLNNRLDEPFTTVNTVTGDYGIKKAEDEYARLINNKTPKSKR